MPARIPMTAAQRNALLALPDTEDAVLRHHHLSPDDLAAVATARTPATRLGYALQLCCLRYPGRHLRRGELLPGVMLDHVAEQVGVEADVIAGFARRTPTRYDQLASIKRRFGYGDLTRPVRERLRPWLEDEAIGLTDGRVLLDRLLDELRTRRIVIPGTSVVERMVAKAMLAAERRVVADVDRQLDHAVRQRLDALLTEKMHVHRSRLSWLREPDPRVGPKSMTAILDKLDLVRSTGVMALTVDAAHGPRMAQFAREGIRYTAQAFMQMGQARRHAILAATLRELEATLTDAAIAMLASMVARAHLRARKRLEQSVAASAERGRERLTRIAAVLEAVSRAVREGQDVGSAVAEVASLETIEADAILLRRTTGARHGNALAEIAPEYRDFKRMAPRFIEAFAFEGRPGVSRPATAPLREAIALLAELGSDRRRKRPAHAAAAGRAHLPYRAALAPLPLRGRALPRRTDRAPDRPDDLGARHGLRPVERERLGRRVGAYLAPAPVAGRAARRPPGRE